MDSEFSGFVLDPEKCNRLSLGEKRKLVHEIAQWSEDAPKILSSLKRGELLEIICAEMGKERKYTGYTKTRMINHLLKLVSNSTMKKSTVNFLAFSPTKIENMLKKPRKQEHLENIKEEAEFLICQNIACRATLAPEDVFCKRCSCCICHQYDDNKDPSLWLTCESDPSHGGNPCGMSCHLKCVLEHERASRLKNNSCTKLDGGFYCFSCGKINGLMRTWKGQLLIAKETRRVDVLCLRLFLSHKILLGTEHYEELQKIVAIASKKLENEVGPLDQASTKMDCGIVNRLSCSADVQKLCNSALEAFDSMFSNPCSYYVDEPLFSHFVDEKEWHEEEEHVLIVKPHLNMDSVNCNCKKLASAKHFEELQQWNNLKKNDMSLVLPFSLKFTPLGSPASDSPSTPCKSDQRTDVTGLSGKKRLEESGYKYSVQVIRWLEDGGHIDRYFRVKFLTWFSLKATERDRRVVSIFVDTLIDDPPGLAGQLIDAFTDEICSENKPVFRPGICTRLWLQCKPR